MLHHLTQLGALGCLPARYNREGGREIPPVNNGTCAFMSAPCLRENFENVWSVCRLLRRLPTPYFHTSRFPSLRLPLLSSPQLFTLKVERLPPPSLLFWCLSLLRRSKATSWKPPPPPAPQQHMIVNFSACRHICGNPFAKFQRVRFTMIDVVVFLFAWNKPFLCAWRQVSFHGVFHEAQQRQTATNAAHKWT